MRNIVFTKVGAFFSVSVDGAPATFHNSQGLSIDPDAANAGFSILQNGKVLYEIDPADTVKNGSTTITGTATDKITNLVTNVFPEANTGNGGTGTAPQTISFEDTGTMVIAFDNDTKLTIAKEDYSQDIVFAPNVTGAIVGRGCLALIEGNGSNTIDLSAFDAQGVNFDNTEGVWNEVIFYYNGRACRAQVTNETIELGEAGGGTVGDSSRDFAGQSKTLAISNSGGNWTGTGGGWNTAKAMDATPVPFGTACVFAYKYLAADSNNTMVGVSTANDNPNFSAYRFGLYIDDTPSLHGVGSGFIPGDAPTDGYWYGIKINANGTMQPVFSSDEGATWLGGIGNISAVLDEGEDAYMCINMNAASTIHTPKIFIL